MVRHLVLISALEAEEILSGKAEYLIKFFKKRPEFLRELASGDLIYFRKRRGEVLGQFGVGKLRVFEGVGNEDWGDLKSYLQGQMTKEVFETKVQENRVLVIIQIEKLEQFITSPIDMPKNSRKEWVVLESN